MVSPSSSAELAEPRASWIILGRVAQHVAGEFNLPLAKRPRLARLAIPSRFDGYPTDYGDAEHPLHRRRQRRRPPPPRRPAPPRGLQPRPQPGGRPRRGVGLHPGRRHRPRRRAGRHHRARRRALRLLRRHERRPPPPLRLLLRRVRGRRAPGRPAPRPPRRRPRLVPIGRGVVGRGRARLPRRHPGGQPRLDPPRRHALLGRPHAGGGAPRLQPARRQPAPDLRGPPGPRRSPGQARGAAGDRQLPHREGERRQVAVRGRRPQARRAPRSDAGGRLDAGVAVRSVHWQSKVGAPPVHDNPSGHLEPRQVRGLGDAAGGARARVPAPPQARRRLLLPGRVPLLRQRERQRGRAVRRRAPRRRGRGPRRAAADQLALRPCLGASLQNGTYVTGWLVCVRSAFHVCSFPSACMSSFCSHFS
ncbi:hypothetical protein HU200_038781 [Digitaria exilis]|uniref:Uncharacterized protein n=1 Tax=Digitaria exilis TaxID=1010633 RepID=A0A835EHV6_9POAL|nr:hypothetical protein HU200_038781 [Digitaria exilis]